MEKYYIYKDSLVSDSLLLQIKDVDGKKGIVTGYFSDFNSIDSDGDIIKPGAFQKSISQNGPQSSKPRIKHLLNHDSSKPLGVLEVLKEDTKGLYYESRLGTHSLGVDFIKMVDSGLITEHSIGFQTVKYKQLKPWNEWKHGEAARELSELKLYEGSSLTAWGANMNTPLTGLKTEQKVRKINDRIDILIKSLRDGTFSDETFDLLEIELKQMQQAMIDLTTEPEQTTQPDEEKAVADIKQFLKTLN